ncbi:MAG: 5'-nucleotidase, lipoprotein e(P4) family [Sarcina sp.]
MKTKKKLIFMIISSFILGVLVTGICSYIIYFKYFKVTASDESKLAFDWLENSGEAEALQYQAYNTATNSLSQMVKAPSSKPKAVILDIDETCLNNAPFQGWQLETKQKDFNSEVWDKWVNYAEATAIPGSVDFTQYAKKEGVQVFYVSGRSPSQLNATIKNMNNLGFADVTEPNHILLYTPPQVGKQPTFDQIEKNYDVVMFIGDSLTDMGETFNLKSNAQEKELVSQCKNDWGSKYICIPDPLYGNFANAIYGYKVLSKKDQVKDINNGLQTFNPSTGQVYST